MRRIGGSQQSIRTKIARLQEVIDQLMGLLEPISDHLEPAEKAIWEEIVAEAPQLLHDED